MTDVRDSGSRQRLRTLRRRIMLGTIGAVALFLAFWRIWDLDMSMFWDLLLGSLLFVAGLAVAAALLATLINVIRRRM